MPAKKKQKAPAARGKRGPMPARSKRYVRESAEVGAALAKLTDVLGTTHAALYSLAMGTFAARLVPLMTSGADKDSIREVLRADLATAASDLDLA